MGKEIKNEFGKIIIAEEVFANLAGTAAMECYGLVGMASHKIKDGIAELLGMEALSKGVQVIINNDQVQIDLFIIVIYGIKISEVANNIISKVRYAVETATGVEVTKVNIKVQNVRVVD
jgi:uncharacterized alkaline shock family protein YloU